MHYIAEQCNACFQREYAFDCTARVLGVCFIKNMHYNASHCNAYFQRSFTTKGILPEGTKCPRAIESILLEECSSAQSAIRNMDYIAEQCNPYFQMTLAVHTPSENMHYIALQCNAYSRMHVFD